MRNYTIKGCKGIHLSVGQAVMGKKSWEDNKHPPTTCCSFECWASDQNFLLEKYTPLCAWAWQHTHTQTHKQAQTNNYAYCLREDIVQLFHHASYFPVCSWKISQVSLLLSGLSADGSPRGRMDVSSRQGHQTDSERWDWQEKERDREKIAGVTASTCSPQLNDQQPPERGG